LPHSISRGVYQPLLQPLGAYPPLSSHNLVAQSLSDPAAQSGGIGEHVVVPVPHGIVTQALPSGHGWPAQSGPWLQQIPPSQRTMMPAGEAAVRSSSVRYVGPFWSHNAEAHVPRSQLHCAPFASPMTRWPPQQSDRGRRMQSESVLHDHSGSGAYRLHRMEQSGTDRASDSSTAPASVPGSTSATAPQDAPKHAARTSHRRITAIGYAAAWQRTTGARQRRPPPRCRPTPPVVIPQVRVLRIEP
jgi:hypothetical protein